jgi:hypothetical protein
MSHAFTLLMLRLMRWSIALVMLIYGGAKLGLLGRPQFLYDWTEVTFRRDAPYPYMMIWHFFGYSRVYGTFIALCEIIPALLLLFPRTATLGAVGVFAVMLQVTVLDWSFGLPWGATLLATALTLGSAVLLFHDRRKLAALVS